MERLQALGEQLDIAGLVERLQQLPLPAQIGVGVVVLFLSLIVLRLLSNIIVFGKPPVFEGIPYIGGLIKFSKGPMKLMDAGYRKYGEVFTVPVLNKKITFLLGPDVSSHFFKATDDELGQKEVYEYSVPTFGKGVVFDVDHKIRNEHFRVFTESLSKKNLISYIPKIVQEAEDYFGHFDKTGVVVLKDALSELTINSASRTLLGREIREQMFKEVSELIHILDLGMQPISVIFPYAPIPAHRRRDKARKELAAIFSKVIAQRRKSGKPEADVMQCFIDAKFRNSRPLTDEEITGNLIAVLFAGQHTSSISSTWISLFLLANKEKYWRLACEEQQRIMAEHGDEITLDILGKMEVLHNMMNEALRLHPPLIMLLRYVKVPFTVTTTTGVTYDIPKGHVVATSPSYSHRLPHVFKNPNVYEPERFAPPREEDKAKPFSFIGFGGGRHGCLGSNFGYMQVKTVVSIMLRNFDMDMIDPFPEPDYESMVVGPKPCRVRYTRRKLAPKA